MHFFYLDETGCSGNNLQDEQEPIFVLGGLSVKDQGWIKTYNEFHNLLLNYFNVQQLPSDFELHANELLSPNGNGAFLGHEREKRNQLCLDILRLIEYRLHKIHYIAIDKKSLSEKATGNEVEHFDAKHPYLLGYDYLVSYIEKYSKDILGHTARAMMIIDIKDEYQSEIEKITYFRRFETPKTKRLKWLVEFTYPVDSARHPMIQVSDLIIYCVRKFLEIEAGYRDNWPDDAKTFFKNCFEIINSRQQWKKLKFIDQTRSMRHLNQLTTDCSVFAKNGWQNRY